MAFPIPIKRFIATNPVISIGAVDFNPELRLREFTCNHAIRFWPCHKVVHARSGSFSIHSGDQNHV